MDNDRDGCADLPVARDRTRKNAALLLAIVFSIILMLSLSGCTGNKQVACCVKSEIYDISANPPAILASPRCVFPNETVFGDCDPVATADLGSTAACINNAMKLCIDITNENDCGLTTTCKWDNTRDSATGKCNAKGSNPNAYWLMPICQDGIPSNCANNMCQAMMCGYTRIKTGPLPTAADFPGDPNNIKQPFSMSDSNEKVNLQGTSCTFKTMNKALYNSVKQSRGGLWVNSFRFGVGRSFADYEQSRLFFPASDKFCSTSIVGGKDRFTNYMNAPSTWCDDTNVYYHCGANNLNFSSQNTCALYCFGRTPTNSEPDCFAGPSTETKYVCLETEFAYTDQQECKMQCSIISDPTKCTDNRAEYPFLESDLRYKFKLNGDYIYSTNTVGSDDYDSYATACKQNTWRARGGVLDRHYNCDDFYPWSYGGDYPGSLWHNPQVVCPMDDPPWPDDDECGYKQNFWYSPSRVWSIDLDYNYYKEQLRNAIPAGEKDKKAYFECDSGDCMSGVCDKTTYHRDLCYNATLGTGGLPTDGEIYNECNCTKSVDSVNCGSWKKGVYLVTGVSGGLIKALDTGGIVLSPSIGNGKEYLLVAGESETSSPANSLGVISQCRIAPEAGWDGKLQCIYQNTVGRYFIGDLSGGACPTIMIPSIVGSEDVYGEKVKVWKYKMEFSNYNIGSVTYGKLGENCRLMEKPSSTGPVSPYLQIKTFGWCQACTYSTLAVQKVEFGGGGTPMNPFGHAYQCLSFRGEYQYDAQLGEITDDYIHNLDRLENMEYGFSVSPIKKNYVTSGVVTSNQNGPVGRDIFIEPKGFYNHRATYKCEDGWDSQSAVSSTVGYEAHGWHQISNPDQAYLMDRMRTYMQSNVMPILDVQGTAPEYTTISKITGFTVTYEYGTSYAPTDICTKWGGDGTAIYAVGDLALLAALIGGDVGNADAVFNDGIKSYLNLQLKPGYTDVYDLNGQQSALYRAILMKKMCPNPPLAALDIGSNTNLDTLIGTGDLGDPYNVNRGVLHKFFYNAAYTGGGIGYGWRVANGKPDDYANNIDLLLQEWTPICNDGTGKEEKTEIEFNKRMAFSRAFLGNFSKPSLIWKFNFPQTTQCDKDYFLEYLFSHQGDMVDAGIIGLVYDNWRTENGAPYIGNAGSIPDDGHTGGSWSNPTGRAGLSSGINGGINANSVDPFAGTTTPTKKTDLFCYLQNQSRKITGILKNTYGQKIYAQEDPCTCEPCSRGDMDNGRCIDAAHRDFTASTPPAYVEYLHNPNLDQLFCLDGVQCTMPFEANGVDRFTNYSYYICPATCLRNTCLQCDNPAYSLSSAYCRVETSDGAVYQTIKKYSDLSDTYWDVVAALPGKAKCCLDQIEKPENGPEVVINYTYISRIGIKQRNEFLQFPRRGEDGLDCGRGVDTSVLEYCEITIPASENHLYCAKIN